jgi:hypothetical protein
MLTRINAQYTEHAHHDASGVLIQALRSELHDRAPKDFDVWFSAGRTEVAVDWIWRKAPGARTQKELRARNVKALLIMWRAIDWKAERVAARQEVGI